MDPVASSVIMEPFKDARFVPGGELLELLRAIDVSGDDILRLLKKAVVEYVPGFWVPGTIVDKLTTIEADKGEIQSLEVDYATCESAHKVIVDMAHMGTTYSSEESMALNKDLEERHKLLLNIGARVELLRNGPNAKKMEVKLELARHIYRLEGDRVADLAERVKQTKI